MRWLVAILSPCLLFADLEYSLDDAGRLKSIQSTDGTMGYSYEYDESGLATTAHDLINGSTSYHDSHDDLPSVFPENFPMLRQEGVQYLYDPLERVAEAFKPETFRFVFTYDGFNRCIAYKHYEWEGDDWKVKSRSGYANLWELLGTALQQYCYHTIPFIGVRDTGIYIGEWMGAVPIPEEDKICCIGSVGTTEPEAKRVHLVVNGLNTSLKDAVSFARFISDACNQEKVIYAYNATHGAIPDVWEYISQRLYIETPSFQICLEAIKKALNEIGPDGIVTIWAHSLGGLILERVLARFSSDEKKKLQIFTFGTSAFFYQGDLKEVQHILSPRDLIPLMGDPLRYFSASWWDPTLIRMTIPGEGWTIANHSFMGPAYKKEILRVAEMLKK